MRVLDLGCGVGGPARTLAKNIGCNIVGITNSAWHVARGTTLTKEAGLEDLVTIVHGDFQVCDFNHVDGRDGEMLTGMHAETALP